MSKKFFITINGVKWKIWLMSEIAYRIKFKDDSKAVTIYYPNNKRHNSIYFQMHDLDFKTIIHELTHAYLSYTALDKARLNKYHTEELFCCFMEKHAVDVVKTARKLHKALNLEAKGLE